MYVPSCLCNKTRTFVYIHIHIAYQHWIHLLFRVFPQNASGLYITVVLSSRRERSILASSKEGFRCRSLFRVGRRLYCRIYWVTLETTYGTLYITTTNYVDGGRSSSQSHSQPYDVERHQILPSIP